MRARESLSRVRCKETHHWPNVRGLPASGHGDRRELENALDQATAIINPSSLKAERNAAIDQTSSLSEGHTEEN